MFWEEIENRLQVENFAESDSVNKQFEKFYEIFYETIHKFVPTKKASRKEKGLYFKSWLLKSILKSITKKLILFKNLQKNFTMSNLEFYKNYYNILNRTIKLAKKTYYKETIDCAKGERKRHRVNTKNKEKIYRRELDTKRKKFEVHKVATIM